VGGGGALFGNLKVSINVPLFRKQALPPASFDPSEK
jgi:hypothetical protein